MFRDDAAIDALHAVDTLIVDKAGTLTGGKPAFDRVVPAQGFSDRDVLQIAASIDQGSVHPLARAVVDEAVLQAQGKITALVGVWDIITFLNYNN